MRSGKKTTRRLARKVRGYAAGILVEMAAVAALCAAAALLMLVVKAVA